MPEEKIKRLTIAISEETHRKLKVMAADTGQSMTDILLDCIERKYAEYVRKLMK